MTITIEYSIRLRLKMLYFYELNVVKKNGGRLIIDSLWRKFFLNILYSITWKRVLSSKYSNRIIANYFQRIYEVFSGCSNTASQSNDLISEFTMAVILLYYLNDVNFEK